LVLDLAQALTRLGIRALAVEANAFKPDSRYHGEQPSQGLVALLDGVARIQDVVTPGNDLLPDRLCVGQAKGRQPLATIAQLRHVFTELAQTYEMILMDAPPLLLSADTDLLIGLSDAALLVVKAHGANKGEVKRAARLLERLSPPVVATILNRVHVNMAGGYFAGLLKEHQSGRRLPASKWLSPWLWK
jgi:Mrp family chromosome partitioning ATPase